ncbi:DUF2884 family protein [Microbulbifer bruguierae]|uniref:DUF2884 family protein n=1 Tax=Microbulbifer bruguierae TaxID=3029061 RepID=A0ABY8N825_9GAMM|nr:DUF2884 family protein [Microbulbifer bruguierae]WGL15041.1 DUF2884 family protein [Microbulbifer bruguierae]
MIRFGTLTAALIATTLAPIALATDINLHSKNGDHCAIELHQQVTVGPDFIETYDEAGNNLLLAYRAPDQLAVGDAGVILQPEQQELMRRYHAALHSAGREVNAISLEAMDVALSGVAIALAALAGPEDPDTQEFLQESLQLREKFIAHNSPNVYTLGGSWMGGTLEEHLEMELEPKIEALAKKSAGRIAWHAMKAVFTGGKSIETQAEAATEAAEKAIEKKADLLEARAERLCEQLHQLDTIEAQLHQVIPELDGLNLVTTK